jgi:hypothetical protein
LASAALKGKIIMSESELSKGLGEKLSEYLGITPN